MTHTAFGRPILAATLLGLWPGAAVPEVTWEDGESTLCRVIADYDARPGVPSLLEQFEHSVFEVDGCADLEGCAIETPLRFEGSVEVAPLPVTAAEGEDLDRVLGTIAASVDYGSAFLQGASGLGVDVSFEPERASDHRVVMIIRDRAMFDAAAEAGTSEAIGQDFPVSEAFLAAREAGLACFHEPYFDEVGLKTDVLSYIVADLPLEDLAACVKSELLGAAGLGPLIGGEGVWEDDWGRGESQGLAGASYSVRDWALLRLLYHPDIPRGTPRDEVMARLNGWYATTCEEDGGGRTQ